MMLLPKPSNLSSPAGLAMSTQKKQGQRKEGGTSPVHSCNISQFIHCKQTKFTCLKVSPQAPNPPEAQNTPCPLGKPAQHAEPCRLQPRALRTRNWCLLPPTQLYLHHGPSTLTKFTWGAEKPLCKQCGTREPLCQQTHLLHDTS